MIFRKQAATLAGLAVALTGATRTNAEPAVACNDTTILPNPVYLAGSSAFEPMLAQLAVKIKAKQNISIIYNSISSCTGVADIADPTQVLSGTAHYYVEDLTLSSGVAINSCTLAAGTKPLIGVSDVFFDSCSETPMPATLGEWKGPEQAMLLIVPEANITTTVLSAEQAAAIWGCGTKGNQTPFIDENAIQRRSQTSGTQILVGRAIGVPETAFRGKENSSGGNLVTSLLGVTDPQTAIGILAADAYDPKRSQLNAVAFRGRGQKKAYYADSAANTADKKNVRDGHYVIQGPLHFFTALSHGQPSTNAKQILDWITGAVPIDPIDTANNAYITTVAAAGNVPQCAMKVQINKDGGSFSPFTPSVSCHCLYEKAVTQSSTAPAGCIACTSDNQCTGGKRCQSGYCE